jgi:hypothetical protein
MLPFWKKKWENLRSELTYSYCIKVKNPAGMLAMQNLWNERSNNLKQIIAYLRNIDNDLNK